MKLAIENVEKNLMSLLLLITYLLKWTMVYMDY